MMKALTISILILISSVALAVSPSPGPLMTYEGVLTDSSGTPLTGSKDVTFQVLYGSCIAFEEKQTVVPGANGEFSALIGSGSRQDSTGNTADRIFASSGSINCSGAAATSVSGFANRSLHIKVDGTDLTPDVTISNVPFAINAMKFSDKNVSDFVLKNEVNSAASCDGTNNFLTWNAATMTFGCSSVSGLTGGTVMTVSGSSPITVSGAATNPVVSIPQATFTANGYLSSADWNTFNSKMSSGLSDGKIFVGNASNVASPVALSGDATLANTGALTLLSVGTAGTYYRVTTDAKGRVTSGTTSLTGADLPGLDWSKITSGKPTTLAGYGITDQMVLNAGGSPSIQSGLDAGKPASPVAGAIYIATDSKIIYQYLSGAWTAVTSAPGGGGTITNVIAGTGLLGGGASGSVSLGLANTAVTAGSYNRANITVDAQGRITAASTNSIINLPSEVTGILPIANGGTGASTAVAAFNALSPISTKGALITNDGTNDVALTVGTNGQILSADSAQAGGLKWIAPPTGTVTNVTGTLPVVVATGTTTPAISVNAATTSTQGVVQVGAGIAVASGTISADPANFPITVPVAKGGTGATSLTANRLIASNGTGSAYTPFACSFGQFVSFDATGIPGCYNSTGMGLFSNGGNAFGAAASLGTTDNFGLNFLTNNVTRMTINPAGLIGIGTTSPSSPLHIVSSGATGDGILYEQNSNTMVGPAIIGKKSYGVGAATVNGAPLIGLYGYGHNGTSFTSTPSAAIELIASQNYAAATTGADINFRTTANNSSGTPSVRMSIMNNGKVFIGPAAPIIPNLLSLVGNSITGATLSVQGASGIAPAIQLQTTDYSAGTAGSILNFGMSAASGNTSSTISASTAGGVSAGNLILQPTSGNVGIGTSAPAYTLQVNGTIAGSAAYVNTSDRRFKKDITLVSKSLDKISQVNGVSYRWRQDEFPEYKFSDRTELGVIAQDVEKIFPEAVSTNPQTGYKSVAYTMLISPIIEALKEVRQWLIGHDREIASLKSENEVLRKQLEQQQIEIQEIKKSLNKK